MGSRKKVKKKAIRKDMENLAKKLVKEVIEPKIAKKSDLQTQYDLLLQVAQDDSAKLSEAIECLKHYIKKDQIGDLANPAIELLTKWGIPL